MGGGGGYLLTLRREGEYSRGLLGDARECVYPTLTSIFFSYVAIATAYIWPLVCVYQCTSVYTLSRYSLSGEYVSVNSVDVPSREPL